MKMVCKQCGNSALEVSLKINVSAVIEQENGGKINLRCKDDGGDSGRIADAVNAGDFSDDKEFYCPACGGGGKYPEDLRAAN